MLPASPDSGTAHASLLRSHPHSHIAVRSSSTRRPGPRSFHAPGPEGAGSGGPDEARNPSAELTQGQAHPVRDTRSCAYAAIRHAAAHLPYGAQEVHLRPCLSSLLFVCKNSSTSLSARSGGAQGRWLSWNHHGIPTSPLCNPDSPEHQAMIEVIRDNTSLATSGSTNLVDAVGVPRQKLCTYCWDGCGPSSSFGR